MPRAATRVLLVITLNADLRVGLGKYDALYRSTVGWLWGPRPGSMVTRSLTGTSGACVVDLGCGDGKNSAWLAEQGNDLVAVDVSAIALNRAAQRFRERQVSDSVFLVRSDVAQLGIRLKFDVAIAYGLFHCLDDASLAATLAWVSDAVSSGGCLVGAVLTDGLPVPESHGTGKLFLRSPSSYVARLAAAWELEDSEVLTIEEAHPPLAPEHAHEVFRFRLRRRRRMGIGRDHA